MVITGARLSTLLGRLPCIPAADAYVCEGGGRIFYPASPADLPTAAPLVEDLAWRQVQTESAGPAGQDGVPPERRAGALWACYARLAGAAQASGLRLDAASYTTAFRVKGEAGAVAAALRDLPAGLATALNLGAADVFPATSGKVCEGLRVGRAGANALECSPFLCVPRGLASRAGIWVQDPQLSPTCQRPLIIAKFFIAFSWYRPCRRRMLRGISCSILVQSQQSATSCVVSLLLFGPASRPMAAGPRDANSWDCPLAAALLASVVQRPPHKCGVDGRAGTGALPYIFCTKPSTLPTF